MCRIAVVGLYRDVDDGEALELSRQSGRQWVAGSAVVWEDSQGIHALAVGVDQPYLSVAVWGGRRVDLHPQLWAPLVADQFGGALPGLSGQGLQRSARGDLHLVLDGDGRDADADDEPDRCRGAQQNDRGLGVRRGSSVTVGGDGGSAAGSVVAGAGVWLASCS